MVQLPPLNVRRLFAALLLSLSPLVAAPPSANAPKALPPELAALDTQFKTLKAERVSGPFNDGVARLDASYLAGLDKALAEAKKAGKLDEVLALGTEKQRVADKQPLPEAKDDKAAGGLMSLRGIYREAYAKLEAARAERLKALVSPLDARLAALEADLTKSDRVEDATTVRSYREALAQSTPSLQADKNSPPATAPAVARPLSAAGPVPKGGFTNSLGMKFVPVPGTQVQFCIHETRYKDYAAYASEVPDANGAWKNQTFDDFVLPGRADEHPVASVSWKDAQGFCAWLSLKEGKTYRLPTDKEWSIAVGIGHEEKWTKGVTPDSVTRNQREFPWGNKWPPPKDSGNYSDLTRKAKAPAESAKYIDGYDDGYPTTAPVMSYKPNKLGIYDLGGNVSEWVEDSWNGATTDHLLRGGAWNLSERGDLLSSFRHRSTINWRSSNYGFRIVVVAAGP